MLMTQITARAALRKGNNTARDAQVLDLLRKQRRGELSWCSLSQKSMAKSLACSRSSVQRSLDRLCEFGLAEKKWGAGDAACAYRAIANQDGLPLDVVRKNAESLSALRKAWRGAPAEIRQRFLTEVARVAPISMDGGGRG